MNSKLKRKVYRGIVYTEEQLKNFGQKLTSKARERVYRGVSYIESIKEDTRSSRELVWRGNTHIG